MPKEIDERLLRITIDVEGTEHKFERLAIIAVGTKYGSAISNVCEVRIANIDKKVREAILTEGTPFARFAPPKNSIRIEAGRVSSGMSEIFIGDITTVMVTQAPDIWLVIRAVTGQFLKTNTVAISRPATSKFSAIAQQVASTLEVDLDFQAPDKDVTNFSFSGGAETLVGKLGEITNGVDAYLDDKLLTVRSRFQANDVEPIEINIKTGMVGLPEFVGLGVRVTVLLRQEIRMGQKIRVTSDAYPAVNGVYFIYLLSFNLANRSSPFFYTLEAARTDLGRKA